MTPTQVKLITRNGKDKAQQFPEIVAALKKLASQARRSLVLDGEIVALIDGEPARFQELQGRMHVKASHMIDRHSACAPRQASWEARLEAASHYGVGRRRRKKDAGKGASSGVGGDHRQAH